MSSYCNAVGGNTPIPAEILGLQAIGLYINKDVVFTYPDISNENEIDLIAHGEGSFVIDNRIERPTWERIRSYSANYKEIFTDILRFNLIGVGNNTPAILTSLRNNRRGFIAEIITTGGQSFVFQSPMFLTKSTKKDENGNTWAVEMAYRQPTFLDKLNKRNTLLMTQSYISLGSSILGPGGGVAITAS